MKTILRPAMSLFVLLMLITGLIYPFAVTGIAGILFPNQASGSLVAHEGKFVGSGLIGQNFSSPDYFWGRLSATAVFPYNSLASGGSNFGPANPELLKSATERSNAFKALAPDSSGDVAISVPVDLVTASASGLDPHISPEAAAFQAPRVAAQRGISLEVVHQLIARYTEGRTLGIFGEPRVHVLYLNLALDEMMLSQKDHP